MGIIVVHHMEVPKPTFVPEGNLSCCDSLCNEKRKVNCTNGVAQIDVPSLNVKYYNKKNLEGKAENIFDH